MAVMVCLAKLSGETKGIFLVGSGYQIRVRIRRLLIFEALRSCRGCIGVVPNEKIEEMITEMKAAVLYGKEDLRLERVAVPQAGPGELVVRVGAALTCGTDLKVYRRGYHAMMLKPPIPFGHEVAGVVAEVGAGVTSFRKGDRVVALNSAPCDTCFFCRHGQQNLCEDLLFNNGAYAEFLRIPARIVEKNTLLVPDGVLLEHAALTEPLACVVRGLEESGAKAGDTMVGDWRWADWPNVHARGRVGWCQSDCGGEARGPD